MINFKESIFKVLAKRAVFHTIAKKKDLIPIIEPSNSETNKNARTFIMTVRRGYDFRNPNANLKIRTGFCNGFKKIGWNVEVISVWNLVSKIQDIDNPLIFLSIFDYQDLSKRERLILRGYDHIVWVHPDNEKMIEIYNQFGYTYSPINSNLYSRVEQSIPNFIFSVSPESGFDFFSNWLKTNLPLKSIPLACDDTIYFEDFNNDKSLYADMAFVGGYWPKKALQFDQYLKPFEKNLNVYGYSKWPYSGYKGLISEDKERVLYRSARISPAISEPHAQFTGDIVERVFKIMGSGGLAITDVNPHYKSLFKPTDLLTPSSLSEYKELIYTALNDKQFNDQYRKAGIKAIRENHTYAHRADLIINNLLP